MAKVLVGVVAVVLCSACATKAGTGALIGAGSGAAVGAGVGALIGKEKGAVIGGVAGAAVGAGAGAAIGKYMDDQEAKLKKLEAAKVKREGDKLIVNFNSAILFDTGRAELKGNAEKDLTELARVLNEYKETNLIIEGHTDSTGKKAFNKRLSQQRAESVIAFLSAKGVDRSRLTAEGYGDEKPAADNKTAAGRQKNRRVAIQIQPNEKLQAQNTQASR